MYEFSIEQSANKINHPQSKEYFREVLSSYFNGNYRSTTVMLWTVVICDLIYKLQYLKDIHEDTHAKSILKKIAQLQKDRPRDSAWEEILLTEVFSQTKLFDIHEFDALKVLQQHRHLSAHPVINKTNILFSPTKELVLSDLRIALESVLIKPPILTKEVFNELVEDLEKVKDLFGDGQRLQRYLRSKYFSKLTNEVVGELFRSLWRISFKSEDARSHENREVNIRALRILFIDHRDYLTTYIEVHSSYLSDFGSAPTLRQAIYFLGDYPQLFKLLTAAAKEVLTATALTDIDLLAVAYFISDDIVAHIKLLVENINKNHNMTFGRTGEISRAHINDVRQNAIKSGKKSDMNILLSTMYLNAVDFDAADKLFAQFIKPFIDDYTKDDLVFLLEGIGINNQTYLRSRASNDHKLVLDRAKIEIFNFDPTRYDFL